MQPTRIFKYPIDTGHDHIKMPIGAKILTAQYQRDELFLWAMVDPTEADENRNISIIGTGWEVNMDDSWQYISTVQEGMYVWHVFVQKGGC